MDTSAAENLAPLPIDESLLEDEAYSAGDAFDPPNWYAWEHLRRALAGKQLSAQQLGDALGLPRTKSKSIANDWSDSQVERQSLVGRLGAMVDRGLLQAVKFRSGCGKGYYLRYELSGEGLASLRRAGPPKPKEMSWREFCGSLAFTIAERADIAVHELLRGTSFQARQARGRLCTAVRDAGWTPQQIASHYGLTVDRVNAAIAIWR